MKICITWASRWIGLSEAQRLVGSNELFLVATSQKSFDGKGFEGTHVFGSDLSSREWVDSLADHMESVTDSLDVLVNNLGVMVMKRFSDMSDDDIDRLVDTNLKSAMLVTRKLLPLLLRSKTPHVVFMSSMAAKSSIVGESVYAATKSGITNFANVLRNEFAGRIRVSVIHAWGVDTWWAPEGTNVLKPESVAEALEFIITRERPFLVESIDLGHENQWRGGVAPWSPGEFL